VAASNGLNLNFRACSGATVANVASSQLSALGPGTNNVLPGRLSTLYGSIRAKAPNARVTVVGYPRIPNRLGQQGYSGVVSPKLVSAGYQAEAVGRQLSPESLARQQRKYAAQDAGITPKEFRLPDLTTPEGRAAARRAGVDLSSRASIDAVDRRYDATQNAAQLALQQSTGQLGVGDDRVDQTAGQS
jgi:hypothetical protein